jgi:predicted enzyme related to lactoylglutathione lyase
MDHEQTGRSGIGIRRVARTVLFVHDMARALRFYQGVLGLQASYPPSPGWAALEVGGTSVGLHDGRAGTARDPHHPILYFAVDDFEGVLSALRAAGVGVETHETPTGRRLGLFHDPEGNALGIEGP